MVQVGGRGGRGGGSTRGAKGEKGGVPLRVQRHGLRGRGTQGIRMMMPWVGKKRTHTERQAAPRDQEEENPCLLLLLLLLVL